jgi:type I restriction-modification system DNA methylase subunit
LDVRLAERFCKRTFPTKGSAAEDTCVVDPACGTGGFLLRAHKYVVDHFKSDLDPDQKKHLKKNFVHGWEPVAATARLCIMNLYPHGIDSDPSAIRSGVDRRRFDYEELIKRDKASLHIFWLKDNSLEDSENLPEADALAQEMADDLQTALDQFTAIANGLKS